jgi:hypothetical protein
MSETDIRLKEISDKISEHLITVKGTLEVLDASVTEDDLSSLIAKAIERIDDMQRLSEELLAVLHKVFERMSEEGRKDS